LGKFFEAMQRAANSPDEASPAGGSGKQENVLPGLDEALLKPEGPEMDDVFPEASEAEASVSSETRQHTDSVDHQEAYLREVVASPPAQPVRDVHTPSGGSRAVAVEKLAPRHPFSTARLVDSGVFRSPVYAAYERIVQRLLKYRTTPRQSLILVTSAVVGEGTSTVARNTALALARHEAEQVLLVDANIRKPAQHKAFGFEREVGLSDVLMGVAPLTSAIRDDDASDLSVMTAGSKVPSPAQLLTMSALQGILTGMLSLYDWVIIDGPALTAYPDSASIAAACGGAVLVIGAESTRSEVVEEAMRILEATEVDMLGAVLNRRRYHIPGFIYKRL
jgi:capsular exopolysaccharide synthesis family protein